MKTEDKSRKHLKNLVLSGFFLALCLYLPFLTGQIQSLGQVLLPMHLPVLICGIVCSPWWGMAVGLCAPILRFVIFQMPPIYPVGISMSLELAAYAVVIGLLYRKLPKKNLYIYVSLLASMLVGRVVMGCANLILLGAKGSAYTFSAFIAGAFTTALPGIICQIILVPVIIMALKKLKLF